MTNPFHKSMDSLRGRKVRAVATDGRVFEGWVERVHHHERDVFLRGAEEVVDGTRIDRGRVLVGSATSIAEVEPGVRVEEIPLQAIEAAPYHQVDVDPAENRQYIAEVRERGWAGSFPTVRPIDEGRYQIVEGHRRLQVAALAGLDAHPVAIEYLDDWTAAWRFAVDHLPDEGLVAEDGEMPSGWYDDEAVADAIEAYVQAWGENAFAIERVAWNADRLGLELDEGDEGAEEKSEEGTESADDVEDTTNPYEPDEFGTFTVKEGSGRRSGGVYLPRRVGQHFADDVEHVHVRETEERFELVTGGSEEWPDYTVQRDEDANDGEVYLGTGAVEVLDVVPGDEVWAEPDDDVVVLEPNRIADRDDEEFLGRYEVKDYGSPMLPLTGDARTHFLEQDVERVAVIERDEGVFVVAGEREEWPDYAVSTNQISLGTPALELLDASEGHTVEATATPDGVRLEVLDREAGGADVDGQQDAPRASTDGGAAVATPSGGASSHECQNCGSFVTERYAAVNAPEGEENPRTCPNCDLVREPDGSVREPRSTGGQS